MCIGSTQFVNAQLLGKWVLPTVDNYDHETYLLSFIGNDILYSELNPVPGNPGYCEIAAGAYNINYDLDFYILKQTLFYGNESIQWNINGTNIFRPEYQIINRPEHSDKYYTFYTELEEGKNVDYHLRYNEIWFEGGEPVVSDPEIIINNVFEESYIAFAITEEEINQRYLYAASEEYYDELTFIPAGLRKWTITTNGVSDDMEEIITSENSDIPADDFSAYNLEFKIDAEGNEVIAWITANTYSCDKVFVVKDGNDTIIDLNFGRIGGIEFSTFDENILYVSCTNSGIVAINYQTGDITEYLTTNGEYGKTFLQTAPDGHIYAVSNNGQHLGRINMQTGNFEPGPEVFSFQLGETVSTYRTFDNQNYFILPENKRQYETLSANIELTDVTCPGWTDGDATIYVSGGTPLYSIECTGPGGTINFTWDVNQNAFYTNNLAEGIYTYTIFDFYENTFPNPPPGTFEIKVDNSNFDFKDEAFEVIADYEFPNAQYPENFYRFELGIHISNNAVLTINDSYFEFGWEGRIIIEPGSKLIVNNSTLTYYALCETKWQGIEVWGDNEQHQFTVNGICYQGYLELKNNSEISYAETGVALWGEENQEWLKAGGIVQSNNTNFINNTNAVHFVTYENFHPYQIDMRMDNLSSFKLDTFDININNVGNNKFYKHADLFGVKGIDFHGCTFTNTATSGVSTYNLGIAAYGGGFRVMTGCSDDIVPCPPQNIRRCTFNGFYRAIGAYSSPEYVYPFQVWDADFVNNRTGIYVSGVDNAVVINNDFQIGLSFPGECRCGDPYGFGIDVHNALGFAIEENYFTKLQSAPSGNYIGIRLDSTLSVADEIYRNEFEGLSVGNLSEGENRSSGTQNDRFGIAYICNDNSNNNYDFYVADNSYIRGGMGTDEVPSGNTLSQNAEVQFQNDYTQDIRYYYYENEPDEVLTSYMGLVFPYADSLPNPCLEHYGGNGGGIVLSSVEKLQKQQEYDQNIIDYNNVVNLFETLKDGGDTPLMENEVETAWPDEMWDLRAELLTNSPHLSFEVLKDVADKTEVFPESVQFDIFAANPDEMRNEEFISYLENKAQPFPDYMIDILIQIGYGSSYKTVLINQMSAYYTTAIKAAQDIIRSELFDSIPDLNEVRTWLGNIGGYEMDKKIISTYMQEDNYSAALNLINALPTIYSLAGEQLIAYNNYNALMQLNINLAQQGRNIFQLDSTEIATIIDIATNGLGSAVYEAKNILETAYGYHFNNCPSLPENLPLKRHISSNSNDQYPLNISVKPNPANNWVAFDYQLPFYATEGIIKITDMTGKILKTIPVTDSIGQKVWDVRHIQSGVYLYILESGGYKKSGKLIIH